MREFLQRFSQGIKKEIETQKTVDRLQRFFYVDKQFTATEARLNDMHRTFSLVEENVLYMPHKTALIAESANLHELTGTLYQSLSKGLEESTKERYEEMKVFITDVECHLDRVFSILGVDKTLKDGELKRLHPKLALYKKDVTSYLSACRSFLKAYESVYPKPKPD